MKQKFLQLLILSFLTVLKLNALDLTITLTAIPSNTPSSANIYIAGSFNNWSENNPNFVMQPQGNGTRQITLLNVSGTIEFKFTRGTWTAVESNAQGNFMPNRTYNTALGNTLSLTIAGWEDLTGNSNSTANSNVQILSNSFFMPELNRNRKIWLYLPNDYATAPDKRYPVIYMHDGQNLFDAATSFSGEWQVDETLSALQNQGDYGAIVIGIDNGGANRLNEYSPWVNAQYGGGQGDLYIDFIKNTLKPYIDENYRTLSTASNTGLIGSSMGGLISLYGVSKFPETFGKGGIFSPSIWFARNQLINFIQAQSFSNIPLRMYFVGGTNESASMVSDMNLAKTNLVNAGASQGEIAVVTHTDGAHSEWYWRREFGAAYQFLFPAPVISAVQVAAQIEIKVFPNPSSDSFAISCELCKDYAYELLSIEGKFLKQGIITNHTTIVQTDDLKPGIYLLKLSGPNDHRIIKLQLSN